MIDEPWATDPTHGRWELSPNSRVARRMAYLKAHGPCLNCGSEDNLELDHISPEDKEYKVSLAFYRRELRPKDIAELAKCRVLCHGCHKLRHLPLHGTVSRYHRGCRCSGCKAGKRERMIRKRMEIRNKTRPLGVTCV